MIRKFVETELFKNLIDSYGEKGLEKRVKDQILKDPSVGDIIQGTGGLRKIRLATSGSGKRGGYRIIYLDLVYYEVTYLFLIYPKSIRDNLTAQQKKILKRQVEGVKHEYKKKSHR